MNFCESCNSGKLNSCNLSEFDSQEFNSGESLFARKDSPSVVLLGGLSSGIVGDLH